jgi:general secretion pathway protein C
MPERLRHDDGHIMNIRQVRLGIDLFTGLVVASVGVALAGLTWRLTGTGARPVAVATAVSSGDPVDIGGLLALAPFGTVEAASDAANDGSLHLKGILLAVPASASSALIAGSDGKVASYGIGAALGGGVVEAIQANQVILRTPRGLQTVGFSPTPGAATATTPGVANPGAGFVAVGTAAPAPAPPLAPNPAGTPAGVGFPITNAAPAALLAAGLQPGDIVEEVNGAPITAGMSADMVARDLAGAALRGGGAQVVVLRNGNRVSLRVAIH